LAPRDIRRRLGAALAAAMLAAACVAGAAAAADSPRAVSIAGDPVVGSTLTATWSGPGRGSWLWLRCPDGATRTGCVPVAGPNDYADAGYTVAPEDAGQYLRAQLVGSDPSEIRGEGVVGPVRTVTPTPTPTPTPSPTPTPTPAGSPAPIVTATATPTASPIVSPAVRTRTTPPRLMRPRPVIRIRGYLTRTGARVTLLTVRAPVGARVRVRCSGSSCPRAGWAREAALLHLRPYERPLRAGTRLIITVTKPRRIGKHTLLLIRQGKAPARRDRCLWPGSATPRRCPG
jgi:hypothetical protein